MYKGACGHKIHIRVCVQSITATSNLVYSVHHLYSYEIRVASSCCLELKGSEKESEHFIPEERRQAVAREGKPEILQRGSLQEWSREWSVSMVKKLEKKEQGWNQSREHS